MSNVQSHLFTTQRSLETQLWLSDAAIRLLCVLALDRFADFISDQVIDACKIELVPQGLARYSTALHESMCIVILNI